MPSTRRAVLGLATLVATSLVAGSLTVPFAAGAAANTSARQSDTSARTPSRADARAALARAQAIFAPSTTWARSGSLTEATRGDASIALRDLALAAPSLGRAGQRTANQLLARPSNPNAYDAWGVRSKLKTCNRRLCVRWTTKGDNAPPRRDSDGDGIPNQVELTLQVMNHVWDTEVVAMRYRRPLTDQRASIDNQDKRFDVYLAALPRGLYGYCAPDDSRMKSKTYPYYDVAAYCVLDDDYARSDFPTGTPVSNLKVTAAHEFQHAIQFAYDVSEDTWIMEATSTWMEDQVYSNVNDNRQYLPFGQLKTPSRPLDFGKSPTWYGNWIFLRWLSETYDPALVRQIWTRLDASAVGPDDYSTQGVASALSGRGSTLADTYAAFAAANQTPKASYSEGVAYPNAARQVVKLGAPGSLKSTVNDTLTHLSSSTVRYLPLSSTPGTTIDLVVDAPPTAAGGRAVLIRVTAGGSVDTQPLGLDAAGDLHVPLMAFDKGSVKSVSIVLVNAGARVLASTCFHHQTLFACGGAQSQSDGAGVSVTATVS